MTEVTLNLEQLEAMMVNVQEDGLAHLATDIVHYRRRWISYLRPDLKEEDQLRRTLGDDRRHRLFLPPENIFYQCDEVMVSTSGTTTASWRRNK
ncbi:hypothetical protein Bca4012_018593 [Brassica carinata]|uniref:Transcriptional factor DELLA N-terminal domain-containing protein n=1 Tax=Brassica carinata TaxID=52824 RepID=A0A8X8BEE0_BRACI|nr:hypothetical protein Bca52824_003020 [Brassica carinata]